MQRVPFKNRHNRPDATRAQRDYTLELEALGSRHSGLARKRQQSAGRGRAPGCSTLALKPFFEKLLTVVNIPDTFYMDFVRRFSWRAPLTPSSIHPRAVHRKPYKSHAHSTRTRSTTLCVRNEARVFRLGPTTHLSQ